MALVSTLEPALLLTFANPFHTCWRLEAFPPASAVIYLSLLFHNHYSDLLMPPAPVWLARHSLGCEPIDIVPDRFYAPSFQVTPDLLPLASSLNLYSLNTGPLSSLSRSESRKGELTRRWGLAQPPGLAMGALICVPSLPPPGSVAMLPLRNRGFHLQFFQDLFPIGGPSPPGSVHFSHSSRAAAAPVLPLLPSEWQLLSFT